METQTTEASEHSTISPSFADHVESSGLTDHVDRSTVSSGLTDHVEHSAISSSLADHSHKNLVVELPNHGGVENKHDIAEDEARSVLETIAATGKFWDEWEKLKSMLSLYLKQVLSKYPEAKMMVDQQTSALGESYVELVKRLDDALDSFAEGPPFTIQRLAEILLGAQNIYPKLSKLALALEKNLLVTSTLTVSRDPHPPVTIEIPNEPDKVIEDPELRSDSVQNGVELMIADRDEIMTEVEADVDDEMTIDMAFEEIVRSSETSPMSTGNS